MKFSALDARTGLESGTAYLDSTMASLTHVHPAPPAEFHSQTPLATTDVGTDVALSNSLKANIRKQQAVEFLLSSGDVGRSEVDLREDTSMRT